MLAFGAGNVCLHAENKVLWIVQTRPGSGVIGDVWEGSSLQYSARGMVHNTYGEL